MSQSDTNFSAKSSILQTSEIFTIVYTNAIDGVILDLQTKAVKMKMKRTYQVQANRIQTQQLWDVKHKCHSPLSFVQFCMKNPSYQITIIDEKKNDITASFLSLFGVK